MFIGQHPEGISIPPPIAIAHHIIRAWVEEGNGVFA
jgi:NAD+ diphosphatase